MSPDDFAALVRARYSVRDFRPDPIDPTVLDAILDDARYSPSWSNTRGYCVALATGERLERLRAAYAAEFDAARDLQRRTVWSIAKAVLTGRVPDGDFRTWKRFPDDLRPRSVQVGKALYQHLGIARGDLAARDAHARLNCEFFGAPALLLVFVHRKLLPFSAQDAGLMLQTMMLAAQARGVGSCALGVLATWRGPVDAEFVIGRDYHLITGLALGYASDDHVNEFRAEHPALVRVPER